MMKISKGEAIKRSHGTISKINAAVIGFRSGKYSAIETGKLVNNALIEYGERCYDAGYEKAVKEEYS